MAMNNRGSRYSRHYRNKVPPFTPDPEHWTRKGHSWKAKVGYDSEDDAWEFLHQKPQLRTAGYTVYQCHVCSLWHIGKRHEKGKGKGKGKSK